MGNKTALITGGTRGIGEAIVLELAKSGVDITFTFKSSAQKAEEICRRVLGEYPDNRIKAIQVDLSDEKEVSDFCSEITGTGFDIVIHNAGTSYDALAANVDTEKAKRIMQLNFWSFVEIVKNTIRPMIKIRSGRYIVLSSIAGIQGNKGNGVYAATKSALNSYLKVLTSEYARKGITANAVAPGFVKTDLIASYGNKMNELESANPSRRLATTEEVAEFVGFLALSKGTYINGQILAIDGGATSCL